jgi:DNA-directed RNA polymerase specialized sigma24 family protein
LIFDFDGVIADSEIVANAVLAEFVKLGFPTTLDDALTRLEQINPRGSEVVQHRFFGGLTLEETAALLGVSAKTVQRDWLAARAWLRKEVARDLGILESMA